MHVLDTYVFAIWVHWGRCMHIILLYPPYEYTRGGDTVIHSHFHRSHDNVHIFFGLLPYFIGTCRLIWVRGYLGSKMCPVWLFMGHQHPTPPPPLFSQIVKNAHFLTLGRIYEKNWWLLLSLMLYTYICSVMRHSYPEILIPLNLMGPIMAKWCLGSYFDVIFLMYLVSSGFSFKPTSSSSIILILKSECAERWSYNIQ